MTALYRYTNQEDGKMLYRLRAKWNFNPAVRHATARMEKELAPSAPS
jgi:hypothetical protein